MKTETKTVQYVVEWSEYIPSQRCHVKCQSSPLDMQAAIALAESHSSTSQVVCEIDGQRIVSTVVGGCLFEVESTAVKSDVLKASAPELLEALQAAEDYLVRLFGWDENPKLSGNSIDRPFALHNQISAALNKATGGEM